MIDQIPPPIKTTAPPSHRVPDDFDPLDDPTIQALLVLREHVACDRRLRHAAIKVLIYLLPELLDRRHRIVKQVVLAKTLRMHQAVIGHCLRLLVKHGHLERGADDGKRHTYRVSSILLIRLRYQKEKSQTV